MVESDAAKRARIKWKISHPTYDSDYRERKRAINRDYYKDLYKNHKDQAKNHDLKVKYGISVEEYHNLLEMQSNGCAICGKTERENRRALDVDHNHSTGEVRGLLCSIHNRGIGYFNDDIEQLQKAIMYLSSKQNNNMYR